MNNKIPFHQLAETVARLTSVSSETAETFIKAFFEVLSETLEKGETVKVKGLGTFAPGANSGDDDCVDFVPDREFADTINAPFAMFQPEELNDGVTGEVLTSVETIAEEETEEETKSEESATPQPAAAEEVQPEEAVAESAETEEQEEAEPVITPAVEPEPEPEPEPKPEPEIAVVAAITEIKPIEEDPEEFVGDQPAKPKAPAIAYAANEPESEEKSDENDGSNDRKGGFGFGFLTGLIVGFALGACAAYFYIGKIMESRGLGAADAIEEIEADSADVLLTAVAATADSVAALPQPAEAADTATAAMNQADTDAQPVQEAAPEPQKPQKKITDTVRSGYLITNMAKKHFGNKCFWVYIYEENSAKLGNPNKVNSGTVVVIPDASKYGIDANNPESVKKARAKEAEILRKYQK